jgi:hypothetical protein
MQAHLCVLGGKMGSKATARTSSAAGAQTVAKRPSVVGDLAQDVMGNQAVQTLVATSMLGPAGAVGVGVANNWDAIKEGASNWWDSANSQSDEWFALYKSKNNQDRLQMARDEYDQNKLDDIVRDLPLHQAKEQYQDELGEVLDRYQEWEMTRLSGKTPAQNAQTQGDFMHQEALVAAQESTGQDNPTAQQIEDAHEESVADQDYITEPETLEWDAMTQTERDSWTARGNAAFDSVLAEMATTHPELRYTRADLVLAFRQVEAYGAVAYTDGTQCFVGMDFVIATELDPAFAISTIVHEMEGHPEFDSGYSVTMDLYDAGAARMPGYTQPADGSPERDEEWNRYGYFESEIGALLREIPYDKPQNEMGADNPMGTTGDLLEMLLPNMVAGIAPELVQPLMEGLKNRFGIDPRITDAALAVFVAEVNRLTPATL